MSKQTYSAKIEGQEVESGDVKGDRECQSDGDGIEIDAGWCRMDATMSSARHNSKQVRMKLLAGDGSSQHGWCNHTTDDTPRPSTPFLNDPK